MTDTEINIAIAEACGWEWKKALNAETHAWFAPSGVSQSKWMTGAKTHFGLPSYVSDLNAMHEAEKSLSEVQKRIYPDEIYAVTPTKVYEDRFLYATARQRAEAFLRTLGKWQEKGAGK